MSTRATYLLPAGNNRQIYFYTPRNGSLKGSARYFHNMHLCENKGDWLAGAFFRVNSHVEFTSCHEEHSNTEFRYTINHQDVLNAWQKDSLKNEWCLVYEGFWHEFVNTQCLKTFEHLHAFKLYGSLEHKTIMTIPKAQKWVRAFANCAKKDDDMREALNAVQVQIDAILAQQKAEANQVSEACVQAWEEYFALFAEELENKIADWVKENQLKQRAIHHDRVALEKLELNFSLFFERLILDWILESGFLESTRDFDLKQAQEILYTRMAEKYGCALQKRLFDGVGFSL